MAPPAGAAKSTPKSTNTEKKTAPAKAKKAPAAPGGSDIRSFFGKTGASQTSASQKSNASSATAGTSQKNAIAIDDEAEEDVKPAIAAVPAPTKLTLAKKASVVKRKKTESESEDDAPPKKKPATTAKPRTSTASTKRAVASSDESESDIKPVVTKSAPKKVVVSSEEDNEDVKPAPKKKAPAKPRASTSSAKKVKKEDSDYEMEDDEEVKKPGPSSKPATSGEAKKPNNQYAKIQAMRKAGPSAPGSKQLPDGQPNCLAGLTFVFTGDMSSISRDEGMEIVKRYGGRVTGGPSGRTSFVVVGDNPGAKKLEVIKEKNIATLDEDGFLNLIATRPAMLDEKTLQKIQKDEDKILAAAAELEKEQRKVEKQAAKADKAAKAEGVAPAKRVIDPSEMLWTTKYAPKLPKDICGNKGNVEKLIRWLENWPKNYQKGFKHAGPDMTGVYRAVLIYGGPGIGKTTTAHIAAKAAGFAPLELNASDARSKKLVESGANIDNRSLDGFLAKDKGKQTNAAGVAITHRTCLIMDEVDGMSSGDRGGVGALNALIKKTRIPIICIANDGRAQKLQPLKTTTFQMHFTKPTVQQVRSRIMTITYAEKMKLPANVVDQLIEGAQSDIRQILNMLSTWKLCSNIMDFDESKALTKMHEKYTMLNPFTVTEKVLGPHMFGNQSRETFGQKMEYYFHDHSMVPLMIFENYIRAQPLSMAKKDLGLEREYDTIKLFEKASLSLSDSDLVDAMIHGNDQHWSLMPLHAVLSTVRPASHVHGHGIHWGGPSGIIFPQWLGMNSKQGKYTRQLADIQVKMRLSTTGSKGDVRLSYLGPLQQTLVRPLANGAGPEVLNPLLERMDSYYLNREDWDTLVELGVGPAAEEQISGDISGKVKGAFTRAYNKAEHPIAYHRQDVAKPAKKLKADIGPAPDLEDAFDFDEDIVEEEDEVKPERAIDTVTKDKLLKKTNGSEKKGKKNSKD